MNQKKPNRPYRPSKFKNKSASKPALKTVREATAGGVVWRKRAEEYEILMIQDRKGRWNIPKGHVEPGESLAQAALREVGEETGVTDLKLGPKLDKHHFFYRREGKLISMTTHVYLMEALGDSDGVIPGDSPGIVDTKWFPAKQATTIVEYRVTEQLFKIAMAQLEGRRRRSASRARFHHRPKAKVSAGV